MVRGTLLLSRPGSRDIDKAYYEPGGIISLSVGSFGVSTWITDKQGKVLITSDTIPIESVSQKFDWNGRTEIPASLPKLPITECSGHQWGPGVGN